MFKHLLLSCALTAILSSSSHALAAQVQVLDDFGNTYNSYYGFFTSQGQSVSPLTHDFGSTNLSSDSLVIASLPNGFSSGELTDLKSYVDGGGRLVLASEGDYFSSNIDAVNSALSYLGSSISNQPTEYDPDYHTTTSIEASPFTQGVSSINYAYSSSFTGGTTLVNGVSGQDLVSFEKIGAGYVFAIADSDLADNISNPIYGNGQLFLNFETASVSSVPLPGGAIMFSSAILGLIGLVGVRHKLNGSSVG